MKAVVFLQNAWSPLYAGGAWPRDSWLRALRESRSGQRLALMERLAGLTVELFYDNASPVCGWRPDSILVPDEQHIAATIKAQNPDALVACGRLASAALAKQRLPLLVIPHPAYRVLTNALLVRAGELLAAGWAGRIELTQQRGKIGFTHKPTFTSIRTSSTIKAKGHNDSSSLR